MAETGLTKNQIIQQLTRSTHGDLKQYVAAGRAAVLQEAEFFAHLIAWNEINGQIRDSKVALPVVSLSVPAFNGELAENSLAHLSLLDPRSLVRALDFAREVKTPNHGRGLHKLVEHYLRVREANPSWWVKTAMQHRRPLKTLYARFHIKPSVMADKVLFKGEKIGVFGEIAKLKDMSPKEAATVIMQRKIPFLVAVGALGKKMQDPDMVLALISAMSATELVSNTKMLERLGVRKSGILSAAYEAGLKRVADSKTAPTFKTTRAIAAVSDEKLKDKLRGVQEKQIAQLGGVEGNWLVLADKSGSMQVAIKVAVQLAATLSKHVKGKVHLIFFDNSPRFIDASGKEYDKLLEETRRITAGGGTSIGCGLQYALDNDLEVDGIAVVSDGGENATPLFHNVYPKLAAKLGKEPPVYFYDVGGQSSDVFSHLMRTAGIDLQKFDLRDGFDYYTLPQIVTTMKTQRYGLIDAIMSTPLLTLAEAFKER